MEVTPEITVSVTEFLTLSIVELGPDCSAADCKVGFFPSLMRWKTINPTIKRTKRLLRKNKRPKT
jgi:hypothetical protein